MASVSAKAAFFCIAVLAICQTAKAKVVSIVDMPGDYVAAGDKSSHAKNAGKHKIPDKRCESFSGYVSEIPPNTDCDEINLFSGITCYRNCRCAYGKAANCTCNSSRYFDLEHLPFGTEPAGKTCRTKSAGTLYYAVRCKKGFTPDAGAQTCSCAYGDDADCLCNSREYPLKPYDNFDYESYNYTKCEYGSYYKISGCKRNGYRLAGGKCVPDCAAGYSVLVSACGEDHKLVEQDGLPVCKKCEKITCPAPYTFVNDCPDGTLVSEHPSQSGCFKCVGVPCRGSFHTYNVCQNGQSRQTQPDNAACVYCEGTPCENGYNLNVSCPAGQFPLSQESNPLCRKCSGTACANGYRMLSSCRDGQKMSVQGNNFRCKKCTGAPCLAGYSTQTTDCASGARLIVQSSNLLCRKCENFPR